MTQLIATLRERLKGHDTYGLLLALTLATVGFVLCLAASPALSLKEYKAEFAMAIRHGMALLVATGVLVALLLADARTVRRIALALLLTSVVLLAAVLVVGYETKGAQRWLRFGAQSLQPVEILKPAVVVMAAWMLSERMKLKGFPGLLVVGVGFTVIATFLLLQPDVGQTALIGATLAAMLVMAGVRARILAGVAAVGAGLGYAAYSLFGHVRARVDDWMASGGTELWQLQKALAAIASGGILGRGPGEGVVKDTLPDAHADFVFAVAAEEYGLLGSLGLIALFGLLFWRGMQRAGRLVDPFAQLAVAGIFIMMALQAAIHIMVNLGMAPAKGMTLPLVSYGGSSLLGAAIALGFAFALSRRQEGALLYDTPTDPLAPPPSPLIARHSPRAEF